MEEKLNPWKRMDKSDILWMCKVYLLFNVVMFVIN